MGQELADHLELAFRHLLVERRLSMALASSSARRPRMSLTMRRSGWTAPAKVPAAERLALTITSIGTLNRLA
jgi:hypothetical protein